MTTNFSLPARVFSLFSADFVIAFFLLLLSFATFYNSFDNAFLMDDFPMLVENVNIGDPIFLQVDPAAKTQVYFRPVTHILNLITFTFLNKIPSAIIV